MQLCPICFWEDAPGDYLWNGSNQIPLPLAQRNFASIGACEPQHLDVVRPPNKEESRDEAWTSFEDSRLRILELIERAFLEVKRDGGVTLHQREAIDDYSPEDVVMAAAAKDPELRWQDIPRSKIEKFGMSLIFFDPKGVRFHLPAFMRCSLQLWAESPYADFSHSDALLYGLDDGPRSSGYFEHAFLLLDALQHQAVAAYLGFVAAGDSYDDTAATALQNGWSNWIPDFIPFPTLTKAPL